MERESDETRQIAPNGGGTLGIEPEDSRDDLV
jgi:hypothetical protein